MLSASDLWKLANDSNEKRYASSIGMKHEDSDSSFLQAKQLEFVRKQHINKISTEKIERLGSLSVGEYDADRNTVIVKKVKGRVMSHYGYHDKGDFLLHPEEALFLMDVGTLRVCHHGIPLSIQEAFQYFLQDGGDITLSHYLVYAYLNRLGYIVRRTSDAPKEKEVIKAKERRSKKRKESLEKNGKKVKTAKVAWQGDVSIHGRPQVANQKFTDKNCQVIVISRENFSEQCKDGASQPFGDENNLVISHPCAEETSESNVQLCTDDYDADQTMLVISEPDYDLQGKAGRVSLELSEPLFTPQISNGLHENNIIIPLTTTSGSKLVTQNEELCIPTKECATAVSGETIDEVLQIDTNLAVQSCHTKLIAYLEHWACATTAESRLYHQIWKTSEKFNSSVEHVCILPVTSPVYKTGCAPTRYTKFDYNKDINLPEGCFGESRTCTYPGYFSTHSMTERHRTDKLSDTCNWSEFQSEQRRLLEKFNKCYITEDVNSLVQHDDMDSVSNILDKLQLSGTTTLSSIDSAQIVKRMVYDVYKPHPNFRKTDPGKPSHRIIVIQPEDDFPSLSDISSIHCAVGDGIPVYWALCDSGDISFYSQSQECVKPDLYLQGKGKKRAKKKPDQIQENLRT